jgi:outer membrane protein TolC
MQESLRLAQVNYAVGTQDITNVLLARQRLGLAQEQLARAAAGVQRADIKLARATGTLLKGIP